MYFRSANCCSAMCKRSVRYSLRLCILGISTWALPPQLTCFGQALDVIDGQTFELTITNGLSAGSKVRFLPAKVPAGFSGPDYDIVPVSGSMPFSFGSYSAFPKEESHLGAFIGDSELGWVYLSLGFDSTNRGKYFIEVVSLRQIFHQGSFIMQAGSSPVSLAGATITATVTSGSAPYSTNGSFQLLTAATGNGFRILGLDGGPDGEGTYTYSQSSPTTGMPTLSGSSPSTSGYTERFSFDLSTNGTFVLRQYSNDYDHAAYQAGLFTVSFGAAPPSLGASPGQKIAASLWPSFLKQTNSIDLKRP